MVHNDSLHTNTRGLGIAAQLAHVYIHIANHFNIETVITLILAKQFIGKVQTLDWITVLLDWHIFGFHIKFYCWEGNLTPSLNGK